MFSAALRLPSSTSWAQRKERVATVIQELGLERCANQKVCYPHLVACRFILILTNFCREVWLVDFL